MQAVSSFGVSNVSLAGEDCLNLNVFLPSLPTGNNFTGLPVAFYMYGGSFVEGQNGLPE